MVQLAVVTVMFLKAIFFCIISVAWGDLTKIFHDNSSYIKFDVLAKIINNNLIPNGRHTFLFVGVFPDRFYLKLKHLPVTFTIADIDEEDEQIDDVVPYPARYVIFDCYSKEDFEKAIFKVVTLPYWHPLANIILIYHSAYDSSVTAHLFYTFWYFRAVNVIIINYDDQTQTLYLSYYTPYSDDSYKLDQTFGCWTLKKITMPISDLGGLICEEGCHNVTIYSKRRNFNLGTCLTFRTYTVSYENPEPVLDLALFEDKSADYHNYTMNCFGLKLDPFLDIKLENGKYTLYKRDGEIWNALSKLMNFSIDITMYIPMFDKKYDYVRNLNEFVAITRRQKDLMLLPIYQFDTMVVELDNTVPIQDSGVCFMSHRAGFETIVFDIKLFEDNIEIIMEFLVCFMCIWMAYVIFNVEQYRRFNYDQTGKDFVNSLRTVLSIGVINPPRRGSFKIFLGIAIWSFFILNFSSQAAIISLFSVYKKGKEVDSFRDILEKDYLIEGILSPDVVLPETEEMFRRINSKVVAARNMYTCPDRLRTDSRRFCVVDCALGRFMQRSLLHHGEQYLHIARKDRIHSHYLQMIMQKHSPMTERFNRYIQMMIEGGLIDKWIDYRFDNVKEDTPVKPLSIDDLKGIFQGYCALLGVCTVVFCIEVIIGILRLRKVKSNPCI